MSRHQLQPSRFSFFILTTSLILLFLATPSRLFSYEPITNPTDLRCIGKVMADYLNAVLVGTQEIRESNIVIDPVTNTPTSQIKIVSPIFGIGSNHEMAIFRAMEDQGANFYEIDAFAGNVYSTTCNHEALGIPSPLTAMDHYTNPVLDGWSFQGAFTQSKYYSGGRPKPVILTEFHDYCIVDYTAGHIEGAASAYLNLPPDATLEQRNNALNHLNQVIQGRAAVIENLRSEYSVFSNTYPEIYGINLFAAITRNDEWAGFRLYEEPHPLPFTTQAFGLSPYTPYVLSGEISKVIEPNPQKSGIHSASNIAGGDFQNQTHQLDIGLTWTVEIVVNFSDIDATVAAINQAHQNHQQPLIRFCYGDECEFQNPLLVVDFVKEMLEKGIEGVVWLSIGPNEAALEHWLSDGCNECEDEIIDPHNPFATKVECRLDKPTDRKVFSSYEVNSRHCNDINITVNDRQICVAGTNQCYSAGSPDAIQVTTEQLPNLDTYFRPEGSRDPQTDLKAFFSSYTALFQHQTPTGKFELSNLPDRITPGKDIIDQKITKLIRILECRQFFNQPNCFLPQKIGSSDEATYARRLLGTKSNPYEDIQDLRRLRDMPISELESTLTPTQLNTLYQDITPDPLVFAPTYVVRTIALRPQSTGIRRIIDTLRIIASGPYIQVSQITTPTYSTYPGSDAPLSGSMERSIHRLLSSNKLRTYYDFKDISQDPLSEEELAPYHSGSIPLANTINNELIKILAYKINKDNLTCNPNDDSNLERAKRTYTPTEEDRPSIFSLVRNIIMSDRGLSLNVPDSFQNLTVDGVPISNIANSSIYYIAPSHGLGDTINQASHSLLSQANTSWIDGIHQDHLLVEGNTRLDQPTDQAGIVSSSQTSLENDTLSYYARITKFLNTNLNKVTKTFRTQVNNPPPPEDNTCFETAFGIENITCTKSGTSGLIPNKPKDPSTPPTAGVAANCDTSITDASFPPQYQKSSRFYQNDTCASQKPPEANGPNDPYLAGAVGLARYWTNYRGTPHIESCYNHVVSKCLEQNYNPAFCILMWIEESDTGNYDLGMDFDFGVKTVANAQRNFTVQLNAFTNQYQIYQSRYPNCFNNTNGRTNLENYLGLWQAGPSGQNGYLLNESTCQVNPRSTGNAYIERMKGYWNLLMEWTCHTDCPFPTSPTDNSCP